MTQVTVLSSQGVSTAIMLNPVFKTTTVQMTVSAGISGSSVAFIQFTLDDPTTTPAPTISWANLSSSITSTGLDPNGIIYSVLSPLGGLRISSTTATITGTVTLKALQSVTA